MVNMKSAPTHHHMDESYGPRSTRGTWMLTPSKPAIKVSGRKMQAPAVNYKTQAEWNQRTPPGKTESATNPLHRDTHPIGCPVLLDTDLGKINEVRLLIHIILAPQGLIQRGDVAGNIFKVKLNVWLKEGPLKSVFPGVDHLENVTFLGN